MFQLQNHCCYPKINWKCPAILSILSKETDVFVVQTQIHDHAGVILKLRVISSHLFKSQRTRALNKERFNLRLGCNTSTKLQYPNTWGNDNGIDANKVGFLYLNNYWKERAKKELEICLNPPLCEEVKTFHHVPKWFIKESKEKSKLIGIHNIPLIRYKCNTYNWKLTEYSDITAARRVKVEPVRRWHSLNDLSSDESEVEFTYVIFHWFDYICEHYLGGSYDLSAIKELYELSAAIEQDKVMNLTNANRILDILEETIDLLHQRYSLKAEFACNYVSVVLTAFSILTFCYNSYRIQSKNWKRSQKHDIEAGLKWFNDGGVIYNGAFISITREHLYRLYTLCEVFYVEMIMLYQNCDYKQPDYKLLSADAKAARLQLGHTIDTYFTLLDQMFISMTQNQRSYLGY